MAHLLHKKSRSYPYDNPARGPIKWAGYIENKVSFSLFLSSCRATVNEFCLNLFDDTL